jgi:hypothetical protein
VETGPWLVERLPNVRVFAQVGQELEGRKHVFVTVGATRLVVVMVVVMMMMARGGGDGLSSDGEG